MSIDYDTIYFHVDNFCEGFLPWWNKQQIESGAKKRNRPCQMTLSEIITILIAFHASHYKCFQDFYLYLLAHGRSEFPTMLSYCRFIAVMKRVFPVLTTLLNASLGEPMKINFIDATTYEVCNVLRASRHKVFKGLAKKSKTSTGWFFGLKLHVIVNPKGEIVRIVITPGNVDDRTPVSQMIKGMFGKLFGDRGYISKTHFQEWYQQGVEVVTGLKKNMKNKLMNLSDKCLLRRRGFIETIFSSIKSLGIFEHARHRSPINAFCHILAGLIAYQMRDDKPSLINELQMI